MHESSANCLGNKIVFWGETNLVGSCLHLYAYRKMIAVKMMLVIFGGGVKVNTAAPRQTPVQQHTLMSASILD